MTTTQAVGNRTRVVSSADDGKFLLLAEPNSVGGIQWSGTWTIEFSPSDDFDGTLVVMGRAPGRAAAQNPPAFVPMTYQADFLNGLTPLDPTQRQNAVITDASSITVPAVGKSIALLVSCARGTMTVETNAQQQS